MEKIQERGMGGEVSLGGLTFKLRWLDLWASGEKARLMEKHKQRVMGCSPSSMVTTVAGGETGVKDDSKVFPLSNWRKL